MQKAIIKNNIIKASEPKRYWLSVHTDENERKQVLASLEDLGLEYNDRNFVYKSEDLDHIKDMARKSSEILKKSKYSGVNEDPSIWIEIVSQPQCPKCGRLGRFSEIFCSNCGMQLTGKKDIEWTVH